MDQALSVTKAVRIKVQAEWALKSKEATDAGYRLLNSSHAVLSSEHFEATLERYSPGTLETLPQVTISWLEPKPTSRDHQAGASAGKNYVGIAIHDQPAVAVVDAGGREFVKTSYYCVEFHRLREHAVSYFSMYEAFRSMELYGLGPGYIETRLGVTPPVPPQNPLAYQAAGLLLTDKSVCVLGADDVSVERRLRFIDEVASLLPYGLRSRLSASTWTSSTYKIHNFRLFFSSVERNAEDFHLIWGHPSAPTRWPLVDSYVTWLQQDPPQRVKVLASLGDQIGFGLEQIQPVLGRLGVQERRALPAAAQRQQPAPDYARQVVALPAPKTVDHLLDRSAEWLDSDRPQEVAQFIPQLLEHLADNPTPQDRERYQQTVKYRKLLRADLRVDRGVKRDFYSALLRIVFGTPIEYKAYCEIERCVSSNDEWPINRELATSIYAETQSGVVQLLALSGIGKQEFLKMIDTRAFLPRELVQMMSTNLQTHHLQFICEAALDYLERRSGYYSQEELKSAFQPAGYLADVFNRIYQNDPQQEFVVLSEVLQLVHGNTLDRETINEILDCCRYEPTTALYATLLESADVDGTVELIWRGFGTYLRSRGFSAETQDRLAQLLGRYKPLESGSEEVGRGRRFLNAISENSVILALILVILTIIVFVFLKILRVF